MKLRVRHNSIRLRLGQSDVRTLQEHGECREAIEFPGGTHLRYVLSVCEAPSAQVRFHEGSIEVGVPASELAAWYAPDRVSIEADIDVRQNLRLRVLIEKDFRCLDEWVSEDQSDTFENPLIAHPPCRAEVS